MHKGLLNHWQKFTFSPRYSSAISEQITFYVPFGFWFITMSTIHVFLVQNFVTLDSLHPYFIELSLIILDSSHFS